jgi:hypothetical protein
MWHTAAYSGTVAFNSSNALLPAAPDGILRVGQQSGFVLQQPMALLAAWAAPANGTAFRLFAPKLAQFGYLQIFPVPPAGAEASGLLVAGWPYRPFTFRSQEEVVAHVDTGGTANATETLIVSYSTGVDPIPPGEELTITFTSSASSAAAAWTQIPYTFTSTLPEGKYALLASELFSTGAVAHRWTFWGQFYRPGFPSLLAPSDPQWPGVRDYRMGLAGQFSNVTPPNLEVFTTAAASSFNGVMRVIKVE